MIFNNFFINIGTNIDDKIPTSINNYADYLKDLNHNKNLFLSMTSPGEIIDIINLLDTHKSTGPKHFLKELARL